MAVDKDQTNSPVPEFDFSSYPRDTLFHERRSGTDRRGRPTRAEAKAPLLTGIVGRLLDALANIGI